ncbi:RmlC-like cupins superfamily protein [Striga asiatica]|uniref:RmlC-like cupins superfamily protein n=1 Tax=Striga asiatica TaxID=4170 RepID=A0A5A7P4H7_STRAF|nr:RmlC-like cupins superfamily protein [Striga asiatica]
MATTTLGGTSCFPNPKAVTNPPFRVSSTSHLVLSRRRRRRRRRRPLNSITTIKMASTETERLGIKIVKNPPESKLSDLGVRSWPKWGCPPSKFPWTYSSKETCYILEGKVKVYPDGSAEDEAVEIGAGDLVVFPKGMSCTWDVSQAVDKHYKFD